MTPLQTIAHNLRDPQQLGEAAALLGASLVAGAASGSFATFLAALIIGGAAGIGVKVATSIRRSA